MAKITLANVPPYDGEYEFDVNKFTGRELHTIKQISGARANELSEAVQAGDYDIVVAFAVIAIRRAGHTVNPDDILDAEIGAISLDFADDQPEVEERPPDSATPNGNENGGVANDGQNGPTAASGSASANGGDQLANPLSRIGSPGSAESVDSDPAMLAN